MNSDILSSITKQDYSQIQKNIESFLRIQLSKTNASGFVFGLSGGIDSAIIAHICANSFKDNSLALIMPDSKVSPKEETEDALHLVDNLHLNYKLIDINSIHSQFANAIEPDQRALGNLRARIRANILYYYANLNSYLVIGSSDKSEYLIGYFTKFGDGSADVLPIVSLYKTQIRELAKHLSIKDSIIAKKSSPHLWQSHIAEEELGVTYEEIDVILHCLIDKSMTLDDAARTTQIPIEKIQKIHQMYKNSQHKRIMPPKL